MLFPYLGKSWFKESRSISREADLEPIEAIFRKAGSVPESDDALRWKEHRRHLVNTPVFLRKSR